MLGIVHPGYLKGKPDCQSHIIPQQGSKIIDDGPFRPPVQSNLYREGEGIIDSKIQVCGGKKFVLSKGEHDIAGTQSWTPVYIPSIPVQKPPLPHYSQLQNIPLVGRIPANICLPASDSFHVFLKGELSSRIINLVLPESPPNPDCPVIILCSKCMDNKYQYS